MEMKEFIFLLTKEMQMILLMLTSSYALHEICRFIISVQIKLITLVTTEILCAINVKVRSYLKLLHPVKQYCFPALTFYFMQFYFVKYSTFRNYDLTIG